jgi:hypothetical protein
MLATLGFANPARRSAAWIVALGLAGGGPMIQAATPVEPATVLVVVGAAGEEAFGKDFVQWAGLWEQACRTAGVKVVTIGLDTNGPIAPREQLEKALQTQPKEGPPELWLVLLGHGTFDGKEAKFNLRGLDISATEFANWLEPFRRPLAVIDTSSSSAPFLAKLSRPGRVIITATRSGAEQNFARFGQYLSGAIADLQADLDKDGQVSLLEAFLAASARVAEFYETEGRLATEHALLDDNGDGLGTPASWFRGVRAVKKAKDDASPDGLRAHQFHLIRSAAEQQMPPPLRARRDELEMAIAKLRESKARMKEDEYYRSLEALLVEMAHLYETGETAPK